MTDWCVTEPPSGGWAVHVPIDDTTELVYQWLPNKEQWQTGVGGDGVDARCATPVEGLRAPESTEDAEQIVREATGR